MDATEMNAFVKKNGFFNCGIGRGNAPQRIHVVFVAVDPVSKEHKVVGVYARASTEPSDDWTFARTRIAALIPVNERPLLPGGWIGQGARRWARHPTANTHPRLLGFFNQFRSKLPALTENVADDRAPREDTDQTYWDISAVEGKRRETLVIQRYREASLRNAKIKQTIHDNGGRLICQVPGCAFDFYEKYGEIGSGYAHVHHLSPLSHAAKKGARTKLDSLAIVCANCHAMIHRDGQCRDMRTLIPKGTKTHR
jgi:hypothetical protein